MGSFRESARLALPILLLAALTGAGCSALGLKKKGPEYPDPECITRKEEGPHYPRVAGVSPAEGARSGGTLVTLQGEGFTQGMSVRVGGAPCVGLSLIDSTRASCHTTEGEVGASDVLVKLSDNRCGLLSRGFRYFPSVVISPRHKMLTVGGTLQFSADEGREPYGYMVESGEGTVDEKTGLYTAPQTAGTAIVRVVDAFGTSSEAVVRVNPALGIQPRSLELIAGSRHRFAIVGGVPPYRFGLKSGEGEVDAESGAYVAPAEPATDVVELEDGVGNSAEATIQVRAPLGMSAAASLVSVGNQVEVRATGGVPPLRFEILSGLGSIDPGSGVFTAGDAPGTTNIRVTDAAGNHLDDVRIQVNPGLVIIPSGKAIVIGEGLGLGASGGVPPYEFSLEGPALGTLSPKTAYFTAFDRPGRQAVKVTDSYGNSAEAQVTISSGGISSQRLAAGFAHSCAVVNGAVKCWGNNQYGQLGTGGRDSALEPSQVVGIQLGAAAVVSGQYHSCALVKGGVKCWGDNSQGQLGNGTASSSPVPVPVTGMDRNVSAIAAGSRHTCVVKLGSVFCWGENDKGQLGNDSTKNSALPVQAAGLSVGATAVSAGASHACALVKGGVRCWGFNSSGQLGNGTLRSSRVPVAVEGLGEKVVVLESGGFHNCALTDGGSLKCWGHNGAGQLGDRSIVNRYVPVEVSGLKGAATAVKLGYYHTCAVVSPSDPASAELQCWGYNNSGQISDASDRRLLRPVSIPLGQGVEAVASGTTHTCALLSLPGGAALGVRCWGNNAFGQFGNRTRLSSASPVPAVLLQ